MIRGTLAVQTAPFLSPPSAVAAPPPFAPPPIPPHLRFTPLPEVSPESAAPPEAPEPPELVGTLQPTSPTPTPVVEPAPRAEPHPTIQHDPTAIPQDGTTATAQAPLPPETQNRLYTDYLYSDAPVPDIAQHSGISLDAFFHWLEDPRTRATIELLKRTAIQRAADQCTLAQPVAMRALAAVAEMHALKPESARKAAGLLIRLEAKAAQPAEPKTPTPPEPRPRSAFRRAEFRRSRPTRPITRCTRVDPASARDDVHRASSPASGNRCESCFAAEHLARSPPAPAI